MWHPASFVNTIWVGVTELTKLAACVEDKTTLNASVDISNKQNKALESTVNPTKASV